MKALHYITQDWGANPRDPRARFILTFFRLAQLAERNRGRIPGATLTGVFYRLIVTYLLGVELPWKTRVGPRLRLHHGVGLVVNDGSVIGSDVTLRHCVTIGHSEAGGPCPVIEDGVDFGANSVAIGGIRIGANARVAAGSVIIRDVPPGTTVVGNPGRALG